MENIVIRQIYVLEKIIYADYYKCRDNNQRSVELSASYHSYMVCVKLRVVVFFVFIYVFCYVIFVLHILNLFYKTINPAKGIIFLLNMTLPNF